MGENLEAKGAEYEERAEKKLKSWGVLGSKYEDAADLLEKAGNSYKLAKTCVTSKTLASLESSSKSTTLLLTLLISTYTNFYDIKSMFEYLQPLK